MKTFKEIREGFVSAAQRRAVWASRADGGKGHPDNKKKSKKEDAVADFLAKGGKIKKLPPAKAQGYHGKDDPGKGMAGMMDKGDTKGLPRKKVKSMEKVGENYQVQKYTDGKKDGPPKSFGGNLKKATTHASMMRKKTGADHKVHKEDQSTGTAKIGIKTIVKGKEVEPKPTFGLKQIVKGKEVKEAAKQTHMFDNEKDARAKAKEIGGKYVKGTGKSMGKHAAIK